MAVVGSEEWRERGRKGTRRGEPHNYAARHTAEVSSRHLGRIAAVGCADLPSRERGPQTIGCDAKCDRLAIEGSLDMTAIRTLTGRARMIDSLNRTARTATGQADHRCLGRARRK